MRKRIDYHLHTKLCRHASGEMEDYVQAALKKNLDEIGFADHIPLFYLPKECVMDDYSMREDELPLYANQIGKLQEAHKDIVIKMGIEADWYQGKQDVIKEILNRHPFDFVLGSIHQVEDCEISDERIQCKLFEKFNHDIFRINQLYYTNLKEAARSGLFDVMSHLDMPKKFGDRPNETINELIEELIEIIAQKKLSIEINTSGFRHPANEQYPSVSILRACYERDIQVTIGSDAHHPKQVGWEFERALAILRDIGYNQVVGFEKRKKVFYEI